MMVQDRPKILKDEGKDAYKDEEDEEEEEEEEEMKDSVALLRSTSKQTPSMGVLDKLTNHFPKVVVISLICLSVFILILVRKHSETGAVLCIESQISKETEEGYGGIPYPSVNFRNIQQMVDTSEFSDIHSENWVVIAVSGPPREGIYSFSKLKGWKTVAVGGYETPIDWNVSGIIYLSPQIQATLPYRIIPHLPSNAFVRKSVGYLFAIHHGAKRIYDADENASVLEDDFIGAFDLELSGANSRREPLLQYLSLTNRTCINPYIHFGQRSVWPRGLPLSLVGDIDSEVAYGQVFSGKQFIQQGLSLGLPDVDSIFYHTRKSGIKPFVISFDRHAPPVALPQGTLAPLNSLNTLFHSAAFWGLMLPVSVSVKASDILRGYWAQRLLWEIGGQLTVHPPSVYRLDTMSPPSYEDEKDMHKNVDRLMEFLVSWRSKKSGIFQKALHLSHSMAEAGFWSVQDVIYTAAWLQDLFSMGYTQPRVVALELESGVTLTHKEEHREFTPLKLPSVHLGVEETSAMGSEMENLIKWRKFYGSIVLILECSWPLNHSALAWKMLYGRMFKSVVMLSAHSDSDFGVEMVDATQSYKVLPPIFEKFPNAEGFLFLKDDVILNYWALLAADKNKLWSLHKITNSWIQANLYREGPAWYQKSNIRRTVQSVVKKLPQPYKSTYQANMDNGHYAICRSNVFYIPHRYVSDFTILTSLGIEADLRHEVAIPLFLLSMDLKQQFDGVAFSDVIYKPSDRDGLSGSGTYSTRPHAFYPWRARNEADIQRIIKAMSARDSLLLKFVP